MFLELVAVRRGTRHAQASFLAGPLRRELGDSYVDALFENYGNKVPFGADLCCYWFEQARDLVENKKCKRAGLLATQGIRGGANREVLKRVKESGAIFFAESDRNWILAGANVHVSLIGFDDGYEKVKILDGKQIVDINPNLTAPSDTTEAALHRHASFIKVSPICLVGASDFARPSTLCLCLRR